MLKEFMKIFARISRHSNRNSEHLPLIHYSETLQTITTEFTQKVLIFFNVTYYSLIAAKNLEGPPSPHFQSRSAYTENGTAISSEELILIC
jgi:hypothetical protein